MSENKLNSDSEEAKNDKDRSGEQENDSKSKLTPSESTSHTESKEDLPGEDKSSVESNDKPEYTAGKISSENTSENAKDEKKEPLSEIPPASGKDIKDEKFSHDTGSKTTQTAKTPKENNYQISLINEDLLKILVSANKKAVKIDSAVIDSETLHHSQTNEINIYPKLDFSFQEAEILIEILNEDKEGFLLFFNIN